MSIEQEIAEYFENTKFENFPEKVVDKAKTCFLDSLGCMLGGVNTSLGRIVVKVAMSLCGKRESTIMGRWKRVSSVNAAFTNSILANALDFDDDYIGHPGATIIPPAIAVGESIRSSGKDILTAIILGYEISLRIGAAIQPSQEQSNYVWGLGTWQTFGSVVAAAKLMRLGINEFLNALGIAGSNAPVPSVMKTVLNPQGPTMVKNNFGFAAASGIIAALLAKEGFTGPRNILDGDTGFWRIYGSDCCNFRKMTEGLGSGYEILNVGFKPYSTCRWIHPAIDASLNVVKMYKINVEDIKEIRVRTLSIITKPPYDNYVPKNMLEAQFSTPFSIAVALYGVEPGPKWFTKATLTNPHILKLAKKVKLIPDKEADRLYPEKMLATVEIDTKLGQYTYKVDTPKGDPSNPMSYEELEDKFKKLASTIIAIDKVKRIVQLVRDLEKIDDIRNIIAMLSR